jgi:ferric-dicitrate binding protein FerR (iron transport regulator)
MSRKHTNAAIHEAVRWFHRFRMKGPTALSPDESAEWARWAANKKHLAEFQRAEQLWDKLQHLQKVPRPTQQELDADDYDPEQLISEWLTRGESSEKTSD